MTSSKHTAGKEKLAKKEKRDMDIVEALQKYDTNTHPSGETLPDGVRVYRVKVLSTFLKAGVPINKIDEFRDLLEEYAFRLAGRKPMSDLIPFILGEEKSKSRQRLLDYPWLSSSTEHPDSVKHWLSFFGLWIAQASRFISD